MTLGNTNVNKVLIVIGGPTAVGKTALSIKVAKHYSAEIISADSRQFYQEMKIGTAKPSTKELASVPHHFINNLSIFDPYDVGYYEKQVIQKLEELYKFNDVVVLVGGSGLYIKAVIDGLDDIPKASSDIRDKFNKLYSDEGLEALQKRVEALDPAYFAQVDQKNPVRLIRALEVIEASGKPYSSFRTQNPRERDFDVICIGLELEREMLYQRIDLRMDQMIAEGLFDEAEKLRPHANLSALQTVGYSEIFGYLNGDYDRQEAIRLLKRNSRRYAKRQLTWFKKDQRFQWFDPNDFNKINSHIIAEMKKLHTQNLD